MLKVHQRHRMLPQILTGKLTSSMHAVVSNDDLLMEILIRLPIISLHLFKFISKRWLSLITSSNFTQRRIQIPNTDPPSGIFLRLLDHPDQYNLMSLDIRIPACKSITFKFGLEEAGSNVSILQSCNGLLLCCTKASSTRPRELYVYNPTISSMLKMLPRSHVLDVNHVSFFYRGIRLAFDPPKSRHYKVVHAVMICDDDDYDFDDDYDEVQIQTYTSETGNWKVFNDRFPERNFTGFEHGIYWNDAIHWLNDVKLKSMHFRLDIVENPVLTNIQLPITGNEILKYRFKLFESRGCLILLCWEYARVQHLTIYDMKNRYNEWSFKYRVIAQDIMIPFSIPSRIYSSFLCIVLGEREEDSFMLIRLSGQVVQYSFVSKTLRTVSSLKSISLSNSFEFIPSFAGL